MNFEVGGEIREIDRCVVKFNVSSVNNWLSLIRLRNKVLFEAINNLAIARQARATIEHSRLLYTR